MAIVKKKVSLLDIQERGQIQKIVEPYYKDEKELIEKILNNNDIIYLLYKGKQIANFFMIGVKEKEEFRIVHLGLSGSNKRLSNPGNMQKLWNYFLKESEKFKIEKKCILYSTTASPYIFKSSFTYFPNTEPRLDFSFSSRYLELRKKLEEFYKWNFNHTHPFILSRFSPNTLYNPSELRKLEKFASRAKIDFSNVNLLVNEGDRILLIHNI